MAKKVRVKRIIKGIDYSIDKNQDGLRSAKSGGFRMAGTNRKPTKKEIQEHYDGVSNGVYMENRPERSDKFGRAKKGERFAKGGIVSGKELKFNKVDYSVIVDLNNLEVEVNILKNDSVNQGELSDTDVEWTQLSWGYIAYPKDIEGVEKVLNALNVKYNKERLKKALDVGIYKEGGEVKNRTTLSEEEKQFVREESQEAGQGYTYRTKVLHGDTIILKEKDGQPIQKFTVDNFEVASKMSAMLNKANDKEKKVKLNKVDRTKAVKKTRVDRTKKLDEVKFSKGGAIKEVDFENSNIIFYGFSHDKNGNSVVKVGFPNQSAFSLQTNDPSWFRFTKGKYTKNIGELEPSDIIKIEEEIVEYIKNFGSKKQKESLKIYSKFKGGVRDVKEIDALLQDAIKKTKNLSAKEIADMWNKNINTEISKSWDEEEVSKNISHFRSYLKDLLFEKQLTEAEYSEYFKDGGSIGFKGLAKKVAKEFEGDKVKPEYQSEYGKTYDKEEAKEVGEKIAGKVYQMQQAKMEQGGEVKGMLSLSEIESKLGKTFSFWNVPYEISVNGNTYRKILNKNEYRKI